MAKNKKNTKPVAEDLIENPEVLVSKTENFFNDPKNVNNVLSIVFVIILIVGGYLGYNYYFNMQDEEAQAEMFQAVYYFERDSLNLALNGDGNNLGFLDIIDSYWNTKSANLSKYYCGLIYIKQGNYDDAIEYLKDFSSSDFLIKTRAYSLIGDAYMELDDFDNAITYFKKASETNENSKFTPIYLNKLGIAYEVNKDYDNALDTYNKIIEEYNDSHLLLNAQKQKAKIEAMIMAEK